jgi:hypothetical protein
MKPPFKHGDKAKYVGSTDRDFRVTNGETYVVFGFHPRNPNEHGVLDASMPRSNQAEISVYVNDPDDDFGGVISLPAHYFEKCFGKCDEDYLKELRSVLGPDATIGSVPTTGMLGAKIHPNDADFFVLAGEEEALIRFAREKRQQLKGE